MTNLKRKIVAIVAALSFGLMVASPAFGATVEELQAQINALLAQLSTLQAQLAALQGAPAGAPAACAGIVSFNRNLSQGMSGNDVKCLQALLNTVEGCHVAETGVGSAGNETTYFGSKTHAAVIKFQEKYAAEVLTPLGLTAGTGFVGAKTRAKLNTMLGPAGPGVPAAGLSVALAPDTPPAKVLASGTSYNSVLKLNLTASAEGAAKVTALKVTKSGFSANTYISGILLVDENGVRHGNVVSSLAADATAVFDLSSDPIVVPAGKTVSVTIQIHLSSSATSGTVQFSVAAPADVSTDATQISGTFPIWGNVMSLTSGATTVGELKVDAVMLHNNGTDDATVVNVSMNTVDQDIAKFRLTAGGNENIELRKIVLWNNGSAGDSDFKNIKLVDAAGNVLATAVSAVSRVVTLDLGASPYLIEKGLVKDFTVRADIVTGSGRTIRFVIQNDYDVVAYGVTTGGSLLAIADTGGTDRSFPIGDRATVSTIYMNKVTIAVGTLSFVRATDSPSTALAAGATNEVLAKYAVMAYGERTELRKIKLDITKGGGNVLAGTLYVKWNDATIWSIDASTASLYDGTMDEYTLTTYPTLEAGVEGYLTVVVSIKTNATSGDSYKARAQISSVKRLATGDILDPGVSATYGNTRSVKTVALIVTTTGLPLQGQVVVFTQGFNFANFTFDAGGSGEDVRITKITVTDTKAASAAYGDIGKLRLYQDSTVLSTTNNTDVLSASTLDFNLATPLVVTKASVVSLGLKADVLQDSSTTVVTDTHRFYIASDGVTASGKDTGTALTVSAGNISYVGTGQAQGIAPYGSLLVTVDSSWITTNRNVVIGTTDVDFTIFKFQALIEDIAIQSIQVTAAGTVADTDYANIRLMKGTDVIASTPQFTSGVYNFNTEGKLTISKLAPALLKIRADIGSAAAAKLKNDLRFNIAAYTDVVGRGVASGQTIYGATSTTAITSTITPLKLTTTVHSSSPSGEYTVISGTKLAVFSVYNAGAATVEITDFKVTDLGAQTGATSTYDLVNYVDNTVYLSNIQVSGGVINFATMTTALTLNAGETKHLAIKVKTLSSGDRAGDTYQMSIAAIGNVKYKVTEADLGYDANKDNDLTDTIWLIPADSTPVAYVVTKK